ncbi:MAG: alpha/beta fold hydrolase [Sulfitobacter sp.]
MAPLQYRQTGPTDAEPVIFLHAGSYSGTMWIDIASRLTGLRCLIPDLPGHGGSQHQTLTSLEQAADSVAELIRATCGERPVTIVGLSFGGYVGLMLLARHPRLVRRAMLSGIHIGAIPKPQMMKLMAALMSPLIRLAWFRRKMAAPLGVTDPDIYSRADGSANVSAQTFRRVIGLVLMFDVYSLLPEIDVPTLIVAGENEHETILRALTEYQERMPNCVARIVPKMGHAWCNQDPDLFAGTVTSWVHDTLLPDPLRMPENQMLDQHSLHSKPTPEDP